MNRFDFIFVTIIAIIIMIVSYYGSEKKEDN